MALQKERFVEILREAKELVALADNDFSYSSWLDAEAAVAEIQGHLSGIERGEDRIASAWAIFAPTGPMQELALSSGWGDEFCLLADRYDRLVSDRERCPCFQTALSSVGWNSVGTDGVIEIDLVQCPVCFLPWIKFLREDELHSRSGRWAMIPVWSPEQPITVERTTAERLLADWHFWGGSYYDGKTGAALGTPVL